MTSTLPVTAVNVPTAATLLSAVEELTRASVREVFRTMLEIEVADAADAPLAPGDAGQIFASVGFVGDVTGVVHLCAGVPLAKVITGHMLGLSESDVVSDEMLNDGFAELGNMVVGWVKSRLSNRGWPCVLTLPSVVRGNNLSIQSIPNTCGRILGFHAGLHPFVIELLIGDPRGETPPPATVPNPAPSPAVSSFPALTDSDAKTPLNTDF